MNDFDRLHMDAMRLCREDAEATRLHIIAFIVMVLVLVALVVI
jgi:hypothetical protein